MASRAGWVRPVAAPGSLTQLEGGVGGRVALPMRLYSSGCGPQRIFDLADDAERVEFYELVLTEGELEDVVCYLEELELQRIWRQLWLPQHVRAAWQPLIDTPPDR